MYSEITMDHFRSPRRVGRVEAADGTAGGTNPVCGDAAEISLRLDGERLAEVSFRAQGCPAVIAACSMLCEVATGLPAEQALAIDVERLDQLLGGLPSGKKHGAKLAVKVLRDAVTAAKETRPKPVNMNEAQGAGKRFVNRGERLYNTEE